MAKSFNIAIIIITNHPQSINTRPSIKKIKKRTGVHLFFLLHLEVKTIIQILFIMLFCSFPIRIALFFIAYNLSAKNNPLIKSFLNVAKNIYQSNAVK